MPCFLERSDYELFLGLMGELSRRHRCSVHAYVLMTNHVHLLLTPHSESGASAYMKDLGQRYAQYVNRTRKRVGYLWENRFRSNPVEDTTYLLTCYRYIELNPVRARMCRSPAEYPWSSYVVNALGAPSTLVEPHPAYLQLAADDEARRLAYREMFPKAIEEQELQQIRRSLEGGFALGSESFVKRLEAITGRPARPRPNGRPKKNRELDTQARLL